MPDWFRKLFQYAKTNILAIFFWIMPTNAGHSTSFSINVKLAIFFWIMRTRLSRFTSTISTQLACYFLLNYARVVSGCGVRWRDAVLRHSGLLFSFELCPEVETHGCGPSPNSKSCYFLLNYAKKRWGGKGKKLRLSCYFLLNYAGQGEGLAHDARTLRILLFSFELCWAQRAWERLC